ncbi:MAG: hypothetical protein ABR608_15525, partial [Pseudonocardiaceae bacterium]
AGLIAATLYWLRTRHGTPPGPRSAVTLLCVAGAAAVATPGVLFVTSWLLRPIYVQRYALVSVPLFALAVGALIRLSPWRVVLCAVLVALSLTHLQAAATGPQSKGEDLLSAATYILASDRAGDCIAFAPAWSRSGLDYYLRGPGSPGTPAPVDIALAPGGSARKMDHLWAREDRLETVMFALRQCPRIWVVGYGGRTRWTPVPEVASYALDKVRPDVMVSDQKDFGKFSVEMWIPRLRRA